MPTEEQRVLSAPSNVSRRTLIAGAAWSVPAIVAVSASPALASSTDRTVSLTLSGGAFVPASGSTTLTATVVDTAGAALPGAAVSLSGPAAAVFGNATGTTDGSGAYSTTVDLHTPWAEGGTTATFTAVSSGAVGTRGATVLGANMMALGTGYGGTAVQAEKAFPAPIVQAVSAKGFSAVLLSNGTVWTVGANALGQLGDGTGVDRSTWAVVPGVANVTQISAGRDHVLALLSDKTVVGWGANGGWQLGSTNPNALSPVTISGVSGVLQVVASVLSSHALLSDGTVVGWGQNTSGEFGDGTTNSSASPVSANGVANVTQLGSSNRSILALRSDGTVVGWGRNDAGQTGAGTGQSPQLTPAPIPGLSNVTHVAGGRLTSVAILSDGTLRAWGSSTHGQLGNGTTVDSAAPVTVDSISTAVAVAGVGLTQYAKLNDGTVWAWGANDAGQLGDGTTTDRTSPVQVQGLGDHVIQSLMVSNGQPNASFFVVGEESLTLAASANIVSAGSDIALTAQVMSAGVAVAGRSVTFTSDPRVAMAPVSATTGGDGRVSTTITPATWLRPGATVSVGASSPSGSATTALTVLGSNMLGLAGRWGATPAQTERVFPSPVVKAVSSDDFSVAVLQDGSLWATGKNGTGQLGDGSTTDRSTWAPVPGLTTVVDEAVGSNFAVALLSDGTVRSWGGNRSGQLGDGTTTARTSPVVANVSQVSAIFAGGANTWALRSDGTVWAWGRNQAGQLGNGAVLAGANPNPAAVSNVSDVARLSCSDWSCIASLKNGTFVGWGRNDLGQLGDGTTTSRTLPSPTLGGLSNVTKLVSGRESSYAILSDGTVRAWGMNEHGQIGDGTTTDTSTPVVVSGLSAVSDMTAVGRTAFALLNDGSVKGWGWNAVGQVGDGTSGNDRLTPVAVAVPASAGKVSFLGSSGFDGGTFFATTFASSDQVNVARGAIATSSSVEGSLIAAGVNDGDPGTRWGSDYGNSANPDDEWVQVDFGGQRTVGRVVLSWNIAYAKEYRIDVSRDGSTWTTVSSTTTGAGGSETQTFTPVAARYVRMKGIKRATGWGYSIYEMEVYAS